jgi:hypothetical protein
VRVLVMRGDGETSEAQGEAKEQLSIEGVTRNRRTWLAAAVSTLWF